MENQIIIGFSRPRKPTLFSKGIMLFESIYSKRKVDFSHAYIQFYSANTDRYLVFQTNRHGAHFIERSRFIKHNIITHEYILPIDPIHRNKALQFCFDYASVEYGFKSIIGMMLARLILLLTGVKTKNKLGDGEKTSVCSEMTAYILKTAGFTSEKSYDWEFDGPTQLDAMLEAAGLKRQDFKETLV